MLNLDSDEMVLRLFDEPKRIYKFMCLYLTREEFQEPSKISSTFVRYYKFFLSKIQETGEWKYDAFIHAVVHTMKKLGSPEGYIDFLSKKYGKFSSNPKKCLPPITEEEQKETNIDVLVASLLQSPRVTQHIRYDILTDGQNVKLRFYAVK